MSPHPIPEPVDAVATRLAQRALAKRSAEYANEVRRLLDAAVQVMRTCGTATRPRVADIVAAAGLSNDAFYRHFPSKDALVAAIVEDGAQRLRSYVAHLMDKESTPQGKVRRLVAAVLSQAVGDVATTTRVVLWNGGAPGGDVTSGPPSAGAPLAELLRGPFAELGSADPDFDAAIAAHATIGMLSEYLWRRGAPTDADVDRVTGFLLRAVRTGC